MNRKIYVPLISGIGDDSFKRSSFRKFQARKEKYYFEHFVFAKIRSILGNSLALKFFLHQSPTAAIDKFPKINGQKRLQKFWLFRNISPNLFWEFHIQKKKPDMDAIDACVELSCFALVFGHWDEGGIT